MRFTITTLTMAVLLAGFVGCDGGSSDAATAAQEEAPATPVNAKPEKFDPAKAQAAVPAGPTTTMVFDSYEHDYSDPNDKVLDIKKFGKCDTFEELAASGNARFAPYANTLLEGDSDDDIIHPGLRAERRALLQKGKSKA